MLSTFSLIDNEDFDQYDNLIRVAIENFTGKKPVT